VTISADKIATALAVFGLLTGFARAKEKDHSADYQVGTFSSTGTVSDGSYANCSGGGCSAYSAAHNVHFVNTADGVYAIEAPMSMGGTMLAGMMTGGNAPTIHKGWFMDSLHEGDKVLFAAKCKTHHDNRTSCEFWLPNPDKTGREIMTFGGFSPAVAKTNTSQLCGTGKLSANVEAQVCSPAAAEHPAQPAAQPQPAAATSQQPQAVIRPAIQPDPQGHACQSVVTDANGNETCQQ
jgi:hypothetical protein